MPPPPYEKYEDELLSYEASGPGMDAKADVNDKGGFDIKLNLKKSLPTLPADYALSVKEPYVDQNQASIPALNILIQIVGSRGDVQPYLSLAIELVLYGHRVRIATHDDFKSFVLVSGKRILRRRHLDRTNLPAPPWLPDRLEFFPIGGDPKALMAYMVKNPGLIPGVTAIRGGEIGRKKKMMAEMMDGCYNSTFFPDPVTGRPFVPDALLCNPPSYAHVHLAEAFGLPLMLTFTMPWSPTTAFKHPLVGMIKSNAEASLTNYLSYGMAEVLTWQGLGGLTNRFRTKRLKLRELANREGPGITDYLKIPYMYCWSPNLIPKPADWKEHIDVSGYYFLEDSDYTPDTALLDFLEAGPTPIYIGFGSIVIEDPLALTEMIYEATAATGVRALVSAGWSKLGSATVPPNIFILGDVPHEWLFSRVAAVCHHGGAGTTACGLRHGRPTIIVPSFGDQPWQGQMVAAAGAGPGPIPQIDLTAAKLADAIRIALDPSTREQAAILGERISQEQGEKDGVEAFHRHLPLLNMRCDLSPERVAAWWSEDVALRLSAVAAETLVQHKMIHRNSLILHRPREYNTERNELYPLAGGVNAIFQAAIDSVEGISQLFYKPHKGLLKLAVTVPLLGYRSLVGFSDGLRNLPSLYGSPMKQVKVDGTVGGFISGGQSFYWGFKEGLGGLVTTPMRGHEQNGWQGAVGGVAQSLLDVAFKPAAGMLALVADPAKGMAMDLQRRSLGKNHPFLKPRIELGPIEFASSSEGERKAILEAFNVAVRTLDERKQGYAALAAEQLKAAVEEQERARLDLSMLP